MILNFNINIKDVWCKNSSKSARIDVKGDNTINTDLSLYIKFNKALMMPLLKYSLIVVRSFLPHGI